MLDVPDQHAELHAYHRLLTTIPPRPYTMLLVKVFFAECNWIYGVVHAGSFHRLLDEWYQCCTSDNPPVPAHGGSGNGEKRRQLSQFPSLLLQVLAVALQMLPREHFEQMSQLDILGKPDFKGLSTTYSNAACELATLLARSQTTLPRAQQWFLRASWLKSEGRAVESWHALGQAIREAQELGLHREQPRGFGAGTPEDFPSLWRREIEKWVWVNLYIWDRFMGMILGRPTLIDDRHCTVTPPLDCNVPNDLTRGPPVPRGPLDPPGQSTQRLFDYRLAHIVNEIDDLQLESAKTPSRDLAGVERLQAKIYATMECYPPALAVTDRDASHDAANPFLRAQAELLKCDTYSLLVALHRPYIFTREKSRVEIVSAGLMALESQQALFDATREHHHTLYTLNFFTFDPAVLMAAVIITSPLSLEQDLLDQAMVHIRSGQKRMEVLGRRVKLAEKGAAVLNLLINRAERSRTSSQHLRASCNPPGSETPPSTFTHDSVNRHSPSSSASMVSEDPWAARTTSTHWAPVHDVNNGFGPINTGILSTMDLDEILSLPDPSAVTDTGTDTATFDPGTVQFGAGILGDVDSDNFWQNLLHVPFQ